MDVIICLFVCFSIFSNFPTMKVNWKKVFVFNRVVRVSFKKKHSR